MVGTVGGPSKKKMDKIASICEVFVTAKGIRDSSDIKIRGRLYLQYLVLIVKVNGRVRRGNLLVQVSGFPCFRQLLELTVKQKLSKLIPYKETETETKF